MAKKKMADTVVEDNAKSADTAAVEVTATTAPSMEDIALVQRVVQDITGCGVPDAEKCVAQMDAAKLAKIVALERDGLRPKIVAILYS